MRDAFRLSALVALVLLFLSTSRNIALAQTATSNGSISDQAKPVLDRAIQFLGGTDNIRALKDVELSVQQTFGSPKGPIELHIHLIYVYPGLTRYEYKQSRGKKTHERSAFFDGIDGWQITDASLRDLNDDEKKSQRQDMFNELPNLLGLNGSPTVTYEGKNGGNDVLLFVLGDLSVRLHIDSTGQVVKQAYRETTGDIEATFSDYRKVGGVNIAYRCSATRNGLQYFDYQITEARANTMPNLAKLAEKPGGSQQTAPLEEGLNAKYPKGTVLNLLATGVTGTGLCSVPAQSTYKVADGKLHVAGFGQNMTLATLKCAIQPIAPGTQVLIAGLKVNQKSNRVIFLVVQGAITSQVDFEFPKDFLATAQLAQVQEVIGNVFSGANAPEAPAEEAQAAPTVSEPIAPPQSPVAPLKLPALYVSAQTPANKLHLNADNSFSLQEDGQPYHGTFVANGNLIELTISESNTTTTLNRQGDDLTDSNGQTWVLREQSVGTAPGGALLHNEDIIKLATVGIDDATIIAKITSSKCQFDTSTDALVQLKKGGVSAAVLKAMVGAGQ